MYLTPSKFQKLILQWYDQHGRKQLPWQHSKNPYRVWVSEIMLQQTQVATVIPYFKRFIKQFPNLKSLALADEDTVLKLWAGLGFYARARNLHKTAKILLEDYKGTFPEDLKALQQLPGIGRSTAGAILSLGFDSPAAILDGNVKRVFSRFFLVEGALNQSATLKNLWQIAESYLPNTRAADYSQVLMDLGALICTPLNPECSSCPLNKSCLAHKNNLTASYPPLKIQKALPIKTTQVLIVFNENKEILLEKRPSKGIWGGLWSLPECKDVEIKGHCKTHYSLSIKPLKILDSFRHTFSHYHLEITPVIAKLMSSKKVIPKDKIWYKIISQNVALPAPIKKLLDKLSVYDPNHSMRQTQQRSRRLSLSTLPRRARKKNISNYQ